MVATVSLDCLSMLMLATLHFETKNQNFEKKFKCLLSNVKRDIFCNVQNVHTHCIFQVLSPYEHG